MKKKILVILVLVVVLFGLTGCGSPALPLRSDMTTDGLDQVVTYNLRGPAGTDQEVNYADLRGLNEVSPLLQQETIFGKMSGSKTQDVQITLEDGTVTQALGMVKTKRFAGLTRFMTLESSTYTGTDAQGNIYAGAKIRLDFNRNFVQYFDSDKRDFQSLWYYDIPCHKEGETIKLDLSKAKLRALVVNEVWQARIATGSYFFNWGHSVTVLDGLPATMSGGWWLNWDIPNKTSDTMGAYDIVNSLVDDLEDSQQPWLEFASGGKFDLSGSYLIYSAGDADRYATFNRLLLNRQNQYSVFYRPNKAANWDYITVKPVYNYEFNDVSQILAKFHSWGSNPLNGKLNESGLPTDGNDSVVSELEKIGWMNAPNASLEQIQLLDSDDRILYTMTVRAYVGAKDTLIMFAPTKPDWKTIQSATPKNDQNLPMPVLYDNVGKKMENQPYTSEQWAEWQRESTIWNFMKSNPYCVNADLFVQYRFEDNTTWKANTDSEGHTISYSPVEWNLSASYYLDGDAKKSWLICQLLGEVGVRTLGLSYCSGRFEGTGLIFALAQQIHRNEYFNGYSQESIWRFDARASQLPDTLTSAWNLLHDN